VFEGGDPRTGEISVSEYPSYEGALQAAGAEVLAFERFGSYQGDWWAKVRHKDTVGWINGSFGSCSGCDAIEAEFGSEQDKCEEHKWEPDSPACADCDAAKAAFTTKYAAFGANYLDGLMTQEEAEKKASENLEWDAGATEMRDFVKANSI
jgi:hypothetical protein